MNADDEPTRVLVVEDDQGIRTMLELALASQGFGVVSAASAEEALRSVDASRPDVVLLDYRLGTSNTAQLIDAVRSRCAAPIVIMSAGERPPDLDPRVADWLSKPFDLSVLGRVVRTAARD